MYIWDEFFLSTQNEKFNYRAILKLKRLCELIFEISIGRQLGVEFHFQLIIFQVFYFIQILFEDNLVFNIEN